MAGPWEQYQSKPWEQYQTTKPPEETTSGLTGAFGAGLASLKGETALTGAKVASMFGVDKLKEAEEYRAKQEEEAKKFKPTEKGWTEAPFEKLKELAGGSAAYMLAPVAAAGATALLPEAVAGAGITALGMRIGVPALASFATNTAQFTGSNIARQMDSDEGKKLADTSLLKAGATAIPQSLLDTGAMGMIPGVRKILGQAGINISEQAAEQIAKKGLLSTAGEYGKVIGKTSGVEGVTETGQAFLERLQAGLNLTDAEARKEYYDNFIGGAVLGGAMGGAGHFYEKTFPGKAPPKPGEPQVEAPPPPTESKAVEPLKIGYNPPVEDVVEKDPLQNPVGNFMPNELTPDIVKHVNNVRQEEGKPKLKSFSVEDLVEAGAPPQEIDRLLAYKNRYDGAVKWSPENINEIAQQKNVDTETKGFTDFLRRATGQADLTQMSQPQLHSAFKALQALEEAPELRVLPEGTNAVRFTDAQYAKALKGVNLRLEQTTPKEGEGPVVGRASIIQEIKDFTGLENDHDANVLLRTAIRNGDLESKRIPQYEVGQEDENGVFKTLYVSNSREAAKTGAANLGDGYTVRDGFREDITFPGEITQLPGGPDIRRGTFKEGDRPDGYEVRSTSDVNPTDVAKTEEEANAIAVKYAGIREAKAKQVESQIAAISKKVLENQHEVDVLKATGEGYTDENAQLAASMYAENQRLVDEANKLKKEVNRLREPLTVVPTKSVTPIVREGFTFFENGTAVASFPEQAQAEQFALSRLDEQTLKTITEVGPTLKSALPKRLAKLAEAELASRGKTEPGIEVKFQGTEEEARERLAKLGIFSGAVQDKVKELEKVLLPALRKLGLEKVGLNIVRDIENNAEGNYAAGVIKIALDNEPGSHLGVLRHESLHALKELGAFTDKEWAVLNKQAKEKWVPQYMKDRTTEYGGKQVPLYDAYRDIYKKANKNLDGFDEYIQEEAIAEAFRHFKPQAGMFGNIGHRLAQFFTALKNAFKGLGFQTADSVFEKIEAGKMRPKGEETKADKLALRESKDTPEGIKKADKYFEENGIYPYLSETPLKVETKYSLKAPSKQPGGNDLATGLPLNKNGSVTLYYHTTKPEARRINTEKTIGGEERIYLTNESSGWKAMYNMGNMPQETDGSVARVEIDPSLLQLDQEYEDGRKDFFVAITEGQYYNKKLRQWALYADRNKPIDLATKYTELGDNFDKGIADYEALDDKAKKARLKEIKELLKREHNVGTLLTENGKLEKTKTGDYGLTYDDQSVASLGLGLASAQKLNEKISTCPVSAICEGLCLGDTSGNNMMYGGAATGEIAEKLQGGKTSFRAGARLSQYLKTEAMIVHPQEFIVLLHQEIKNFEKWARKNDYKPAIRLNVTSDIPPKYYQSLIEAHPDTMFYDYTKLGSKSVAPNHHLTYSSTGASQIVNGEKIENKDSNWDKMRKLLDSGNNVAMAFTSKSEMPKNLFDEETGKTYQVWDGDNYDARFLDPKREDGVGMIVGLTNKASTLKENSAAKETRGFFLDYNKARDGDTLTIRNLKGPKVIPIAAKYSLRANPAQTETTEFKQWFGKSKIVTEYDTSPVSGEEIMEWLGIPEKNQSKYWRNLKDEERDQLFKDYRSRNGIGQPKVMYHGTSRDISVFRPKQAKAIFVTDSPLFAGTFAGMSEAYMVKEFANKLSNTEKKAFLLDVLEKNKTRFKRPNEYHDLVDHINRSQSLYSKNMFNELGYVSPVFASAVRSEIKDHLESNQNIVPVYVRAENPFDYNNSKHVERILKAVEKFPEAKKNYMLDTLGIDDTYPSDFARFQEFSDALRDGQWEVIEAPEIQYLIKKFKHDGFYVTEAGERNLAVYEPSQVKSATGNVGTFDINNPDIRYSIRANLPASVNASVDATTTARDEKGFVERLLSAFNPETRAKLRAGFIFQFEAFERGTKARAAKLGNQEYLADVSATAAALQSMQAKNIVEQAMRRGVPVYRNGFTTTDDKFKGLMEIFAPLGKTGDPEIWRYFQFYAAAKRGYRMKQEGRENLFKFDPATRDDLAEAQTLAATAKAAGVDFDAVYKEYQQWNEALVKFMKDTGVLSDTDAAYYTKYGDYIPFYRQIDGEETLGPKIFSSFAGVQKPKAAKGGTAKLGDFLENVIRNASAAVESGMKNVAANRGIRDAVDSGTATQVNIASKDTVTVLENGVKKFYELDDPLLFEAFKGLNVPRMPWLQILAKPADVLRNFVTKDPGFALANIMRDSVSAWVTSGSDMRPVIDSFKQAAKILANKSPEAVALAKAGLGGYEFKGNLEASAKAFEKALRAKTGTRTTGEQALLPFTKLWDMLEQGSNASDMATRAEIYKRVLAETGNEAEAVFQASEVMNFSRRGNFPVMQVLTAIVPFMNARIQGLDVLYRSGFGKGANANTEKMQKAFIVRSMAILGMTAAYWFMVHDDDEYKKLTKEERDGYWIVPGLKFNDKPFRFPIPFEIGVVFKVFPERIAEYIWGTDTEKDFAESITRNIVDTLKFNPIPQAVVPWVENITNHSFFTGEKIIGRGLENVAKPEQYTASTSLFARAMGDQFGVSPVQLENLIRGYTGTMGMYAVNVLDSFFGSQGDPVKATTRAEQLPVIKRFFASDSGTVAQYYDLKDEVDEVVRTVNFLSERDPERLEKYLTESKMNLYSMRGYVSTIERHMKQIRSYRTAVNSDKTMGADEKRAILDELHKYEVDLTADIRAIRKEYH